METNMARMKSRIFALEEEVQGARERGESVETAARMLEESWLLSSDGKLMLRREEEARQELARRGES